MTESGRVLAVALLARERSRRLRLRAEGAREESRRVHRGAALLLGACRAVQIDKYARCSRRRLAGGSDTIDHALSRFARDVAHELTPAVCNLWLRIELMRAELGSDQPSADVASDLSLLQRLAGQVAAIVKGLSCLAQSSSLDVQLIDLNAFLAEALSPITHRLAPRGVAVRFDRGQGIPRISVDADTLRYVMASLIETVAETSTTVSVVTRSGENGAVRLDIGTGRKPGAMRAITSSDALRLVLSDAIVRNSGGRVERHVGNPGTTFTVSFRAVGEPSTGARSVATP